ncbi:hypothetical protein QYF36_019328 [Acer negundo]|nr:hypothetical protein QYF36_019328 [Acer negundo]
MLRREHYLCRCTCRRRFSGYSGDRCPRHRSLDSRGGGGLSSGGGIPKCGRGCFRSTYSPLTAFPSPACY